MIDLIRLNSEKEDKSPNSWVWISGKGYRNKINTILEEILKNKNITKSEFIQESAKDLHCSVGPLNRFVYNNSDNVPIPILNKLVNNTNSKKRYYRYFINNATYIFTARQKGVFAVKNITAELAEIMGAFAADGNITVLIRIYNKNKEVLKKIMHEYNLKLMIQKDRDKFFIRTSKLSLEQLEMIKKFFDISYSLTYLYEIVDADKTSIKTISNKIEKVFGVTGKIQPKKNAWSLRLYNKVLIRYFRLFGFKYGRKTETVAEPLIIRNSSLTIRHAFARGVITFDGSVKYSGEVSIALKSKKLISDISDILYLLKIKCFLTKRRCIDNITIDKNNKKVLFLFIPYTKKWFRSKNYLHGFENRVTTIEDAKQILYGNYDKYNRNSAGFKEIIQFLEKYKSFNSKKINNVFNKTSGFFTRLKMLNQMNIIHTENILKRDIKGRFKEKYKIYHFNPNLKEWRLPIS